MSATEKLLGKLSPERDRTASIHLLKTTATSRTTRDTPETTVVRSTGAIARSALTLSTSQP
ncbi:hypothetical protein QUB63_11140 [Microcoleus sp. ARI1-B5]|uniref:hypothetical protein n=1 Tax=unclassified Microcoleus TaxID=2642155 RepID=UPI002FCF6ED6